MEKVKIIVPITGESIDAIREEAERCAISSCDLVEWRYDLSKNVDLPETLQELKEILKGKEILFTIRTKAQGGAFTEGMSQYVKQLLCAVQCEIDYVDLEEISDVDKRDSIVENAHRNGVKVIASYHDFSGTPSIEEILTKLRELRMSGADILKTAYMPNTAKDVASVLYATAAFREEDLGQHELITMSMGELGRISRISGGIFGSNYTFTALKSVSAPGQMPLADVERLLHYFD